MTFAPLREHQLPEFKRDETQEPQSQSQSQSQSEEQLALLNSIVALNNTTSLQNIEAQESSKQNIQPAERTDQNTATATPISNLTANSLRKSKQAQL
jgi:hypothetical protein